MSNLKSQISNENGQIVLILILVMTVALAIGISVVQRSLSDISTSTKVEESSRAFSAAEAGIEKSLVTGNDILNAITLENSSQIRNVTNEYKPAVVQVGYRQDAYEILGGLKKEDVATIWLADPNANLPNCAPSDVCYRQPTLDVYWGDPNIPDSQAQDRAALELTLIYYDGSQYKSRKWYLEDDSASRTTNNNFTRVTCNLNLTPLPAGYKCKFKIGGANNWFSYYDITSGNWINTNGVNTWDPRDPSPLPLGLMLLRARLLYNSLAQPFAVQATSTCGQNCSLPAQTRVITSTGVAGVTQRTVRVSQELKAIPPYFDYAIFSAGDITK